MITLGVMERAGTLGELRKDLDLPQKVVAAGAGMCRSYVALIEAGRLNPTRREVRAIARALGVPERRVMECLRRQGSRLWKSTRNRVRA